MKTKISDMMDCLEEVSVNIHEMEVGSIPNIKEATLKRIAKAPTYTNPKTLKFLKVEGSASFTAPALISIGIIAASVLLITGTVAAHFNWNGFAYLSNLSKSEQDTLAQDNSVCMSFTDTKGNVHYLDANGNETKVLSAEEAAAQALKAKEERARRLLESTGLVDINTLPLLPSGITEMTTGAKGEFEDFALGNGYMVVLRPENQEHYSLKKGDTVLITLNDEEDCILEYGMIKDGIVIETDSIKMQKHLYSFEIPEDGAYNFYIMYYSANKGIFTDCALTVN